MINNFEEAKIIFFERLPKICDSLGNIRKDQLNRYLKRNPDFKQELSEILALFPWIQVSKDNILYLFELRYCFENNITTKPLCPNCGNQVPFSKTYKRYMEFCSKKCKYEYEFLVQEWKKEPNISEKQKVLEFIKKETYKSDRNQYVDGSKAINFCKIHSKFINKVIQTYCPWISEPLERKLTEIIFCLENNITEDDIKCKVCGSRVSFNTVEKRYGFTCSNKNCQALYSAMKRTKKSKEIQSEAQKIRKEREQLLIRELSSIETKLDLRKFIEETFLDSLGRVSYEKVSVISEFLEVRKLFVKKVKQILPWINLRPLCSNPTIVISEIFWNLKYNISKEQVCPICGTPKEFQDLTHGYKLTCGNQFCISKIRETKS